MSCDSDYYNGEDWMMMMMMMIIHGRKSAWCRVPLIITPNVLSVRGELPLQCVSHTPKKDSPYTAASICTLWYTTNIFHKTQFINVAMHFSRDMSGGSHCYISLSWSCIAPSQPRFQWESHSDHPSNGLLKYFISMELKIQET